MSTKFVAKMSCRSYSVFDKFPAPPESISMFPIEVYLRVIWIPGFLTESYLLISAWHCINIIIVTELIKIL